MLSRVFKCCHVLSGVVRCCQVLSRVFTCFQECFTCFQVFLRVFKSVSRVFKCCHVLSRVFNFSSVFKGFQGLSSVMMNNDVNFSILSRNQYELYLSRSNQGGT